MNMKYISLTFYVLEQSLWRKQREADGFQHLHYMFFPFCHILENPVHGYSEYLVLILNSQLFTSYQPHQLFC